MTGDDHVKKFGNFRLYNNDGLLFCECCDKKVGYEREDYTLQLTYMMRSVSCICVVVHRSFWHWVMMNMQSDISNNSVHSTNRHQTRTKSSAEQAQ